MSEKVITFNSPEELKRWLVKQGHSAKSVNSVFKTFKEFHAALPQSIIVGKGGSKGYPANLPPLTLAIGVLEDLSYRPFGEETQKEKAIYKHKFGDMGDWGPSRKEKPLLVAGPDEELYIVRGTSRYALKRPGVMG